MSHFFAYISKMKWIRRWGLMKNTRNESLSEHALDVATLAHLLAVLRRGDSYGYQLVRDVNEWIPISESTLYPILNRL